MILQFHAPCDTMKLCSYIHIYNKLRETGDEMSQIQNKNPPFESGTRVLFQSFACPFNEFALQTIFSQNLGVAKSPFSREYSLTASVTL